MKYHVHLYTVVRVRMQDIEADGYKEAIAKAEHQFAKAPDYYLRGGEEAEWNVGALVDVDGDEEYEQSEYYDIAEDGSYKQSTLG